MSYDPNPGISSGPYDTQEDPPSAVLPIILSALCVFCCQPLAIGGIVLAILGMSKGQSGDIEGAKKFIRYAYILSGVGLGGGILLYCSAFAMAFLAEMM